MSNHDIKVQAWGDRAVAVCLVCGGEGGTGNGAILKATGADGFSYAALVAAIELHTGEGANRALIVQSERVPGQIQISDGKLDSELLANAAEEDPCLKHDKGKNCLVHGPFQEPELVAAATGTRIANAGDTTTDELVAYGPVDDFGPGYNPRTGQRNDGGPSVREYLESRGEL